ncbi:dephospho-CoA kinase [Papillibacter cinnamivorans]|uniref:Dephospho-CoA kinase n=1 Tax=Papillibacter cinnamivorans DSM 12816 TaxID=1122930 RepID=A0A1W1YJ91_9FIRM|nr:dephospho-CoA kinase [Papillibacter cinnamivorans]SMC36239.1 dephospho-CoA kinase [Papillibacter cinnamivorans DSM 12816]
MFIIGITGGTGAGKTTALRVMEELGGYVVDCDELYHDLLRESEMLKLEIVEQYGDVLTDGQIDRKKLGEIVFRDEASLLELENISHRYVKDELGKAMDIQRRNGRRLFAVDAIALFESGLSELCDVVVGVIAAPEVRIRRIMAREGIGEEYARLRVNAQKPDSFYRERCNLILENKDEPPEIFASHCRKVFSEMLMNR